MSGSNMYRGSIAVLLQAILTQACRVVLAFSLLKQQQKFMNKRLGAMVRAYVSEGEASSLIEGTGKHALLTAVHLLCCEQRPHTACQHHNGELAAAVSSILEDFPLRSNIITALTGFITRKWEHSEVSIHRLLSCAVLVGPKRHTVTSSVVDYRSSPIALLLYVYPELANSGSVSEVSCGCTHQWFRETLPLLLLSLTMEQHAKLWCRNSLLSVAFLRWRQRHGMYLLQSIAAGNYSLSPPMEISTQAPSTVISNPREENSVLNPTFDVSSTPINVPVPVNVPPSANISGTDTTTAPLPIVPNVSSASTNPDGVVGFVQQKSVENSNEKCTAVQPIPIPSDTPLQNVNMDNKKTDTVQNGSPDKNNNKNNKMNNDRKMLKTFILQCDRLAAERVKRETFFFWRDVRLLRRRQLQELIHRFTLLRKQECWLLWKRQLATHLLRRRGELADEQCSIYIEAKKESLRQHAFSCWKQAYMVRQFRLRTCGFRLFSMWRRHFLFSRHSRGAALPLIASRALVHRCLLHWRLARLRRLADRRFLRGFLLRLRGRLSGRAAVRRSLRAAAFTRGFLVRRRVLAKWRVAWGSHRRLAAAAARKDRRTAARVLQKWRIATRRRVFEAGRQNATRQLLWERWKRQAEVQRRWRSQHERHAEAEYGRRLLQMVWRRWCHRHEKARLQQQQQEVITWFAAKGHANASLGVNCSFPAPVGSVHNNSSHTFLPHQRTVEKSGLSVSFADLRRSPPRKDPLAVLRAERRLLHEMNSPQWQNMAHSRLFNNSNNSNATKSYYNHRREKQHQEEELDWKRKGRDDTMVIMMPSDVEDDNSPSVDNSRL